MISAIKPTAYPGECFALSYGSARKNGYRGLRERDTGYPPESIPKMKILIVTFDPPENVRGTEGRESVYTKELLSMGHLVELVSFSRDAELGNRIFQRARLSRLSLTIRSIPMRLRLVANEIASSSIDSIFFLTGAQTLFAILGYFIANSSGKTAVV